MRSQGVGPLRRRWSLGLLRHSDFRNLWVAQTVSVVGSQFTSVALPLTAVLILQAGPFEMGVLGAAVNAPVLLVGLFAGVWADRLRRRPILIATDLGRALLLGVIPTAALLGVLRMEILYVVALSIGTLSVFFDVAVTSYLPSLVRREDLIEGNSKIQLSHSAAGTVGPGTAGGLVQLFGAPFVLILDALSFLASAAFLWNIRSPEPTPLTVRGTTVWREIYGGMHLVWRQPVLRAMTLATGVGSLGNGIQQAVLVLYIVRDLGVTPVLLGVILAVGSAAAILGAMLAGPVGDWQGPGPVLQWGQLAIAGGSLILALAAGPLAAAVALLLLAHALRGCGMSLFSVNQIALRQAITPSRLLGRVNATRRVVVFGVGSLGALLGGALGAGIGLQQTLLIGAGVGLLSFVVIVFSRLRTLRQLPSTVS